MATYQEGQVYRLNVSLTHVTTIEFGEGESIRSIIAGDTEGFEIDGVPGGQAFAIKPVARGVHTNVTVYTNLTGRALGWRLPTNLELLVELDMGRHELQKWERSLMSSCVSVTAELRDLIAHQAADLAAQRPKTTSIDVEHDDDPGFRWIPLCPSPERLFKVYAGELDEAKMVRSAFEFAQRDLRTLGPPKGYSEEQFLEYVADRLQQLEVVQKVVSASSSGVSDSQAAELIADYIDVSSMIGPTDAWRILKQWMMHFFPEQYRIEVGQEVLVKGRTISSG